MKKSRLFALLVLSYCLAQCVLGQELQSNEIQQIEELSNDMYINKNANDFQLANLEKYDHPETILINAPKIIQLVAELMLSSGKVGSINLKTGEMQNFTYLKAPYTYRTSSYHLSEEISDAFTIAHNSMYEVKIRTTDVEDYLKVVQDLLYEGTEMQKEQMLPYALNEVADINTQCVKLTKKVEDQFNVVEMTARELMTATLYLDGVSTKNRDEILRLMEKTKMNEKYIEDTLNLTAASISKYEEAVNKKDVIFKQAMEDMILSPEEIKALKDADFEVKRVEVGREAIYKEVKERVADPVRYVTKHKEYEACTGSFLGICFSHGTKYQAYKEALPQTYSTVTKTIVTGYNPVYKDKIVDKRRNVSGTTNNTFELMDLDFDLDDAKAKDQQLAAELTTYPLVKNDIYSIRKEAIDGLDVGPTILKMKKRLGKMKRQLEILKNEGANEAISEQAMETVKVFMEAVESIEKTKDFNDVKTKLNTNLENAAEGFNILGAPKWKANNTLADCVLDLKLLVDSFNTSMAPISPNTQPLTVVDDKTQKLVNLGLKAKKAFDNGADQMKGNKAIALIEEVRDFYTKYLLNGSDNPNNKPIDLKKRNETLVAISKEVHDLFNQTERRGTKEGNAKLDMKIAELASNVKDVSLEMKANQSNTNLGEKVTAFLDSLNKHRSDILRIQNANDNLKQEVVKIIEGYENQFKPILDATIDGFSPSAVAKKRLESQHFKLNDIIQTKVPLLLQKSPKKTLSFNHVIPDDGSSYSDKMRFLYIQSKVAEQELRANQKALQTAMKKRLKLNKKIFDTRQELQQLDWERNRLDKLTRIVQECMSTLGDLKRFWKRLNLWFSKIATEASKIATEARVAMEKPMDNFITWSNSTVGGAEVNNLLKKTLEMFADKTVMASNQLNKQAHLYHKVSTMALMPSVSKISSLIAHGPSTETDPKLIALKKAMDKSTTRSIANIQKIIKEQNRDIVKTQKKASMENRKSVQKLARYIEPEERTEIDAEVMELTEKYGSDDDDKELEETMNDDLEEVEDFFSDME